MPDTQISEEICLAAAKSDYAFDGRGDWDKASRIDRERYCERCKKGLQVALSGYVVVPREPTEAMIYAGRDRIVTAQIKSGWPGVHEIYRAMIQAAPPVQEMEG